MKFYVQIIMLALVALATACGSNMISSTYSSSIAAVNVRISEKLADGSYTIMLGAASTVNQVSFCYGDAAGTACAGEKVLATNVSVIGERKVFQMASNIMIPEDGSKPTLLLLIDDVISRKVQFEKSSVSGALGWKIVLMASDQSNQNEWINAFDNARIKLKEMFMSSGVPESNIQELSLRPEKQIGKVKPVTNLNFRESVESMKPGPNEACLIHMTSHGSSGSQNGGFNMGRARLNPVSFDNMVTLGCGDRPTVVMISACFSGMYLQDQFNLKKPNRIILSAAAADKTSFGCSSEATYVFWDGCLIENLPTSKTFKDLASNITKCIERKESNGDFIPSDPQTFIGDQVQDLPLPGSSGI